MVGPAIPGIHEAPRFVLGLLLILLGPSSSAPDVGIGFINGSERLSGRHQQRVSADPDKSTGRGLLHLQDATSSQSLPDKVNGTTDRLIDRSSMAHRCR